MSVVVAGASGPVGDHVAALRAGQVGNRVTRRLLAMLDPAELVLVTRNPERLAPFAGSGAEIRVADFDDPGGLAAAFAGGDRLVLVALEGEGRAAGALVAAAEAGMGAATVVTLASPLGVAQDTRGDTRDAWSTTDLQVSVVRSALPAETLIAEGRTAVASGRFVHNFGRGRVTYLGLDDLAAAAVAAIVDGFDGRDHLVTGAAPHDAVELAALFGELGGADVNPVEVGDEAMAAELISRGIPDDISRALTDLGRAVRDGQAGRVTSDFERLTGRTPLPVRDILLRARDEIAGTPD